MATPAIEALVTGLDKEVIESGIIVQRVSLTEKA